MKPYETNVATACDSYHDEEKEEEEDGGDDADDHDDDDAAVNTQSTRQDWGD